MITASTILKTKTGDFRVAYHEIKDNFCISFSRGNLSKDNTLVRIHSSCLFGEVFDAIDCDCGPQLLDAIHQLKGKNGVIIYLYQEGRGIGIKKKIQSLEIQRTENLDTVDAFKKLGLEKFDYRDYTAAIEALHDLKVSKKIKVYTGHSARIEALKKAGFDVTVMPYDIKLDERAKKEWHTKKTRMGYIY